MTAPPGYDPVVDAAHQGGTDIVQLVRFGFREKFASVFDKVSMRDLVEEIDWSPERSPRTTRSSRMQAGSAAAIVFEKRCGVHGPELPAGAGASAVPVICWPGVHGLVRVEGDARRRATGAVPIVIGDTVTTRGSPSRRRQAFQRYDSCFPPSYRPSRSLKLLPRAR